MKSQQGQSPRWTHSTPRVPGVRQGRVAPVTPAYVPARQKPNR